MPWRKKRCKKCGRSDVSISRRHLCHDCAIENIKKVVHQIRDKKGPAYEKYKEGTLNYLGLKVSKNSEETVSSDGNP